MYNEAENLTEEGLTLITHKGKDFFLKGEKFNIYAGAIHYFRTLPEYWEDRLLKLKLAGFNTVETYVCWNLHEPKKGEFDFSGMLDIERFLDIAQYLGLNAIVRPGPYICAEWDFGGLPSWLLKDKNMRIRCMDPRYTDHVRDFYKELFSRLYSHQVTQGGNIIAMQVENEYGSYGNDKEYLAFIENLMKECGCEVMMFTSDGPENWMLSGGTLPHIFKVANFGSRSKDAFRTMEKIQPDAPLMCGEFWNGWFDHWGEKHHSRSYRTVIPELKAMLSEDGNFSFYMFHGGTNFGFNSGANFDKTYQPTVTSYDDDALLTEWGGYTPKYHAVRKVLLQHRGLAPAKLPPEPELQNIGEVKLIQSASLMQNLEALSTKYESAFPKTMEELDQFHGLILYRKKVKGYYNQKLYLDGLGDRAYIFVDGDYKGLIYRNDEEQCINIGKIDGEAQIDVLVESMGRINYGVNIYDRKGVSQIRLGNQVMFGWEIFSIPLTNISNFRYTGGTGYPLFKKGTFRTSSRADCFVHLDGFTKGYVFINGFNLGRYWDIGPQKSLYLPGVLLQDDNEITVLELEGCKSDSITITDTHDIGKKKKFLFF